MVITCQYAFSGSDKVYVLRKRVLTEKPPFASCRSRLGSSSSMPAKPSIYLIYSGFSVIIYRKKAIGADK